MTGFTGSRTTRLSPPFTSSTPRILSSRLVKTYTARYQNLRKQAIKRLRHPFLPWILLSGFILWVGISLSQIWLRLQPILTAHALSQEVQMYQNLIEQKKKLGLELSQKRSQWYSQAQKQFDMVYPTEFIVLHSLTPPQNSHLQTGAALP